MCYNEYVVRRVCELVLFAMRNGSAFQSNPTLGGLLGVCGNESEN